MYRDRWIRVVMPRAVFAVVVRDGVVVDAAPIARWAVGQDERKVAAWFRARGARFEPLRDG